MGGRPEPPGWHGTARPRPSLASAQQLRGDFGRDRPEVQLVLYLIHRPRLCSSAPAAAAEGKFLVAAGGSGEHPRRCRRLPRIPLGRRGQGPACPRGSPDDPGSPWITPRVGPQRFFLCVAQGASLPFVCHTPSSSLGILGCSKEESLTFTHSVPDSPASGRSARWEEPRPRRGGGRTEKARHQRRAGAGDRGPRGQLCPPLSSVPVSGQPPADLHPHRPRARQGEMPASLPSGAAALCQTLCVAALADAAPQTTATATATATLLGF